MSALIIVTTILAICCAAVVGNAATTSNYTIVWTNCVGRRLNDPTTMVNMTLMCNGSLLNIDVLFLHLVDALGLQFRVSARTKRNQEFSILFEGDVNGCELLDGATFNPFVHLIYGSVLKTSNFQLPPRCPLEKVCIHMVFSSIFQMYAEHKYLQKLYFIHDYQFREQTAMLNNLEMNLFIGFRSKHSKIFHLDLTGTVRMCDPMFRNSRRRRVKPLC